MIRRLRDFEWTFSNTAEGATAFMLLTVIAAALFA